MTVLKKPHTRTLIYFLLSLLAIITVTSCSNEPIDLTGRSDGGDTDTIEAPDEDADLIVNTWELTDVQLSDATAQLQLGNQTITQEATGTGSEYDLQVTFDEDGNLTSMGSYVQSISVKLGLQVLDETREIKAEDLLGSGTWSRTETLLTLNEGTESQEIEIVELTENNLILRINTIQTETVEGIPVTLIGTVTASFNAVEG